MDNWGPLYTLSLDLKVNSEERSHGFANILAFKTNRAVEENSDYEGRIEAIFWDNSRDKLRFISSIGRTHTFDSAVLSVGTWYSVEISQTEEGRRVGQSHKILSKPTVFQVYHRIKLDGVLIDEQMNSDARLLKNVHLFVGHKFSETANASFRNFFWENIGESFNKFL